MMRSHLESPRQTPQGHAAHDAIRTVTGDTFQALVLDADGPIAVEFMSYGCGYCRALEPSLQEVAETLRAKEPIFRVNIAVEEKLAADYQVEGTPTLVMFRNGLEQGRVEGPPPSTESLLEAITRPFEA